MSNPKKNAEGYNDPTPYEAEKHIRAQIRGKQARLAGSYFEACLLYTSLRPLPSRPAV